MKIAGALRIISRLLSLVAAFTVVAAPRAEATDCPITQFVCHGYELPFGTVPTTITGSFHADIYESSPAQDIVTGEVQFALSFTVPTLAPPSLAQCDPNSPLVGAIGCARSCAKKDDYVVYQSAPLQGIPVFSYSPTCNAPVLGSVTPVPVSMARAACEESNSWGGATQLDVVMHVGALYQFHNPRTWQTGGIWHFEDTAELFWPHVRLQTPVQIACHESRESSTALTSPRSRVPGAAVFSAASASRTVLEGESLARTARATAGGVFAQQMADFGSGWSGNAQLFWTPQGNDATLTSEVSVRGPGVWEATAYLTTAPDYGVVEVRVVDARLRTLTAAPLPPNPGFDGYGAQVRGPVAVPLGRISVSGRAVALSLRVAGRNRQSSGYYVGLDRIELRRVSDLR
jgi:hypothetical protein